MFVVTAVAMRKTKPSASVEQNDIRSPRDYRYAINHPARY